MNNTSRQNSPHMEIEINVTQACINKAIKELSAKVSKQPLRTKTCPVAQALKKQKIKFDHVVYDGVFFLNDISFTESTLPKVANEFILLFDNKLTMKKALPFSFQLEVPEHCLPKSKAKKK